MPILPLSRKCPICEMRKTHSGNYYCDTCVSHMMIEEAKDQALAAHERNTNDLASQKQGNMNDKLKEE